MNNQLKSKINELIESVYPKSVQLRRTLHQMPELSGAEFETARFIHSELNTAGFKPAFYLNKNAVITQLQNNQGKTVVLRADMDALPINEETGVPFTSKKPGIMHACGHDIHSAILFGAGMVLNSLKDYWKGNILLVFQPSEEVEPGGAIELLNAGAIPTDANGIFGLHVSTDYTSGTIGIKEGTDYAGVTIFDILINGKGGHGATPQTTIDPVVCGSSIIIALQTLVSRETSPLTPVTLTVGSFHSGNLRNIIPDHATFSGTLRCHDSQYHNVLQNRIEQMVKSIAASFRANAKITFKDSYPPNYNDPDLSKQFVKSIKSIADYNIVIRSDPIMYAEDFAYYQEKIPGIYAHLGVKPKETNWNGYGIHTSKFNPDESSIKAGIAAHVAFTLDMLN
ncbi:MAG TPA: M20 family metallopeptidase [Chitinispirillaceae bacterium]|nr:M20 family metallopeptidase [Chitinispirillaceae bacterium]